jgi:MFS transporter, PAT family, beta-lactamase induction signal transducer AmpG
MDKLRRNPLFWVPTLYLAMGIPFNVIMGGTAARMYKSLGYGDAEITVALGSIGVAWSLKPLWAAFLDMYRTKKFFVLSMELFLGLIFAAISMTLPMAVFFQLSIALFWVAAFASSTQDICADGVYLTSLDKPAQARLAGVQGTFWVLGKVLATGILISALDRVKVAQGWPEERLWQMVMLVCAVAMIVLLAYHFFMLPAGSVAQRPENVRQVARDFVGTAVSFFHKRMFWGMIAFVFLYRLGEGLILMEGQLFLQSEVSKGGLGLSAGQVSEIDAIFGTIATIVGGLLGGVFVSRFGLARVLLVLGLCLNVPHFTYVYLSQMAADGHGVSYATIVTMVSIEKFGYGFGFVGNMIYMMQQLAPGRTTMTHYAFATALMNLVLVPTNMISGPLAEWAGFSTFFLIVMFASVPSVIAAWRAPFPLNTDEAKTAASAPASARAGSSDAQVVMTPDDPSLLSPAQREVQVLAGRASIYAMLHILAILLIDAKILGTLQGRTQGEGATQFWFLCGSVVLKLFLTQRTFALAGRAKEAAGSGEHIYVRNARGAKNATLICLVVSAAILAFGARMAF